MSEYWKKQVVLITGSSRGIGRDLAIHFSQLGCKVAINYAASEQKAKDVLAQCNSEHTRMYKADVGNESEVNEMIEKISNELGNVTILVNNAGQTRDGLLMVMKTQDWKDVMNTHLDGMFYCSRAVLRGMLKNKGGRIINMASVSGIKGTPGQTNYSAAKAGMIGFTKALAREMGKRNITCNAIAPGVIETEMTEVLSPEVLTEYKKIIPLQRFGNTSELSALVEYLASEKAAYVTGQCITIDGGMI